ncbi:hypothetical protein BO85DRAFT_192457 [Aspergillus piperis CBS 112811]|uniref:Uncharacterized protein n=1 Tax=Aspergillus piperis CBS 112811 TaxID=1448313 RepID=A0A8G1VPS0_9EURO|nr:hypothetical protein BO85DRAFT_192457 [Aspergillus piperis CBS 112811]RAH61264.1 hypothetical protein BO85DRAFT_192457 [Aspergillus piperis CBS 112811]
MPGDLRYVFSPTAEDVSSQIDIDCVTDEHFGGVRNRVGGYVAVWSQGSGPVTAYPKGIGMQFGGEFEGRYKAGRAQCNTMLKRPGTNLQVIKIKERLFTGLCTSPDHSAGRPGESKSRSRGLDRLPQTASNSPPLLEEPPPSYLVTAKLNQPPTTSHHHPPPILVLPPNRHALFLLPLLKSYLLPAFAFLPSPPSLPQGASLPTLVVPGICSAILVAPWVVSHSAPASLLP